MRDHLLNLSPLPSHPLLLLLSIYPPLSPLSCSWPKCKNRYPFVSAPWGNESVWIRLSVLSVAANFLSPLTQLMTDTLTCTCRLAHYCTCAKRESWMLARPVCAWVYVCIVRLHQGVLCDCARLFGKKWQTYVWSESLGGRLNCFIGEAADINRWIKGDGRDRTVCVSQSVWCCLWRQSGFLIGIQIDPLFELCVWMYSVS